MKKLEDLLKIVLKLKKELNDSYSALKNNLNPLANIEVFKNKSLDLKEIAEKIKNICESLEYADKSAIKSKLKVDFDEGYENIKNAIKAEMVEIAQINRAFSDLIKKNIYYNQLTISFITEAFSKSSLYGRNGQNDTNFLPLKNILLKSGVRV